MKSTQVEPQTSKKTPPDRKFSEAQDSTQYHGDRDELPTMAGGGSRDHAEDLELSSDENEEEEDGEAGDDIRADIISEQSFLKEQSKSQAQNARRFKVKALDAIEDRELEDREPMQTAVGIEDLDSAVSPQADSPGDSEEDATNEFLMGVNFRPEGEDAFEEEEGDDEIEDFEKSDRTVYAEQKSAAAGETPSSERDIETRIDEKSEVVSTGRPSPRSDVDSVTSTH